MELFRLNRKNHLVLVEESKLKGLKKAEAYITFGEINDETLAKLLQKRGRIEGNKKLSEKVLKEKKIASFEALAKELISGKITLKKVGIKQVFRLNSPRKGFERKGIKKPFTVGGTLGYRKDTINALIERMM
jgi:large subunit ribosomal protein L30